LQGGYTSAGEVVCDDAVDDYLRRIAVALDLQGSANVQLIRTDTGPMAFEINPRFSSTVMFRHLMGFRDFVWALQDLKEIDLEPYQPVKQGTRFYRCPREFLIPA
jgi:carbamoyl-phosphate synthase large subunit